MKIKRALIITNHSNPKSSSLDQTVDFAKSSSQLVDGVEIDAAAIQQLVFSVRSDSELSITLDGEELHEHYGVIHIRNVHMFLDYANALGVYCQRYGLICINRADSSLNYLGKVSQGFLYAANGIPTPPFISSASNQTLLCEAQNRPAFDYPLIVKNNNAMKGASNFLVGTLAELVKVLSDDRQGYLIQPFIKNHGELRILTFGDVEPIIFKKSASPDTHLNNTSQGGQIQEYSSSSVDSEIMSAIWKILGLLNRQIAGVDVLLATDGSWTILEVNHTPALGSGVLKEKKHQAYATYVHALLKHNQEQS